MMIKKFVVYYLNGNVDSIEAETLDVDEDGVITFLILGTEGEGEVLAYCFRENVQSIRLMGEVKGT